MSEPLKLRLSQAADDYSVGELLVNAFHVQYSRKMPEARATPQRNADLRNQAENRATATVLVAELDGKIVGSVTVAPWGAPSNDAWIPGAPDIRYLAVDPDYHGHGFSKTLLDEAERIAWSWEVPAICLHVRRGVEGVARLYRSRGYVREEIGDVDRLPAVYLEAYALRR